MSGNIKQLGYRKAGKSPLWVADAIGWVLAFGVVGDRGPCVYSLSPQKRILPKS